MDSRKKDTSELVPRFYLKKALQEDLGRGDKTTDSLIPKRVWGRGRFLAKQPMVLSGIPLVKQVFELLSSNISVSFGARDGDRLLDGTVFGHVQGPLHLLLKGERLALNLIQHLSGISTLTDQFCQEVRGTRTKILDTRKTTPLLRKAEKYAVRMGGGTNHRLGLFDQILIKDNHIDFIGDIAKAITLARKAHPKVYLVVEIRKKSEIEPAISSGADRLLLDNMTNQEIQECIELIQGRCLTEVSGKIALKRVSQLARLGVDFISVGALTHSAPAADISLKISADANMDK